MTTHDGLDDDIELNIGVPVDGLLQTIENDPKLLALIERITRQQSMRLARRVGNTSGKYAQRQLPQGVINQNPSTKRIF